MSHDGFADTVAAVYWVHESAPPDKQDGGKHGDGYNPYPCASCGSTPETAPEGFAVVVHGSGSLGGLGQLRPDGLPVIGSEIGEQFDSGLGSFQPVHHVHRHAELNVTLPLSGFDGGARPVRNRARLHFKDADSRAVNEHDKVEATSGLHRTKTEHAKRRDLAAYIKAGLAQLAPKPCLHLKLGHDCRVGNTVRGALALHGDEMCHSSNLGVGVDVVKAQVNAARLGEIDQLRCDCGRDGLPLFIERNVALRDAEWDGNLGLRQVEAGADCFESAHGRNTSATSL